MKHLNLTIESNPGIFRGLINFTSTLDSILKEHFNTVKIFKGTSKEIQNDLLDCMLQLCYEAVLSKISSSDYISLIADETTDMSSKCQMAIIMHYVLKNDKPVEHFWILISPGTGSYDASALSDCIKMTLHELTEQNKEKLISQSYDGANVEW